MGMGLGGIGKLGRLGRPAPSKGGGASPAQQWLSRIPNPGEDGRAAYSAMIDALVAEGVWDNLDGLLVPAWNGQKSTFLLNVRQDRYHGTVTGPDAYDPVFGWRGTGTAGNGGTDSHIDTGFNPATAGGKYQQNSAHIGAYSFGGHYTNEAACGVEGAGGSALSHIYGDFSDGLAYFRVNDASASATAGISGVPSGGFLLGNRSSSTGRQAYRNGVRVDAYGSATSGALVSRNLYFGGANVNGTTTAKSRRPYLAFCWGGSLTSDQAAALYAAVRTYVRACMAEHGWSYEFLATCFTTSSENLFFAKSDDGCGFVDQGAVYSKSPDGAVRDPTIYLHDDGYLYSCYTRVSGFNDATSTFSVARSTDGGANWTRLGTVDCSAVTGGVGSGRVWAPKLRKFGSSVYAFFSYDEDTTGIDLQIGFVQATDLAAMSWGTAQAVTGTAFPSTTIDFWPVLKGSTYYGFCKNENTQQIIVLSSSSLLSGYDTTLSAMGTAINAAAGGVLVEGPVMVQIKDSYWRLYLDRHTSPGESYLETFDDWATFEPVVLARQTAVSPMRHATILLKAG